MPASIEFSIKLFVCRLGRLGRGARTAAVHPARPPLADVLGAVSPAEADCASTRDAHPPARRIPPTPPPSPMCPKQQQKKPWG